MEVFNLVQTTELKVEELVKPGKFGVTNKQMIPAMKKAVQDESAEQLQLLRASYLYAFDKSIRYLKKDEREFVQQNMQ